MLNRSQRHVAATVVSSAAAFILPLLAGRCEAVSFTGVNLAGAEFGSRLPGTYNSDYTYPTTAEINYFVGKGLNTFRVPYRWERLQPTLNTPLNSTELSRLDSVVTAATSAGAYVILDPHNYARYWVGGQPGGTETLIGSATVPNSAFADFWTRTANQYKSNSRVIFSLMNEPNTMPTEQWRDSAQAAINAIRATGATNLILVPGNAWTGAHSWLDNWYGTPNGSAMLAITDPGNNFAFDVHQYLDNDSSGTSSTIVSAAIGQQRLVNFTNWLHANNRRGFLGEFAVANSTIGTGGSQIGDEAIHNMLNYIDANRDVWLGWTWWAAGPWWGNYMFTLEPTNLGQPSQADRPAMGVLQQHLAIKGDYNGNGTVEAADYVSWRKRLDQSVTAGTAADGDGNGVIGQSDYSVWRQTYGKTRATGGSGAGSSSIPEPGSAVLVFIALVVAARPLRPNQRR